MLQNATPLRKSAPWPPNISDEHVFCTAPATRNASLKILFNVPRLPLFLEMLQNPHVLLTFDKVHNPLRLPRETSSEHPKVVRTWCVLYILTSKCASRHNGVHFFDIATSKSGPKLVCFVHFDFDMCFAPQRRALFRHLNFQKWSGPGVFCTFWLRNVLRATTACNFSSLIWPDGSAPAALANLLFDPPEPQIIGKTQCFATFLPFRAPAASFFWLFLLWPSLFYSSLLSDSSHLCFSSVHIVGSLTSKLPSDNQWLCSRNFPLPPMFFRPAANLIIDIVIGLNRFKICQDGRDHPNTVAINSAEVRPLQALCLVLEVDWNLDCTALGGSPPCFQINFQRRSTGRANVADCRKPRMSQRNWVQVHWWAWKPRNRC